MQKTISIWNAEREKNGLITLEIGIGIHSGEVVAGNVGAANHLSYTVLGNIVNLSARLCDEAKPREILTTEQTIENIKSLITYTKNSPKNFKGISNPIITYSIHGKKK